MPERSDTSLKVPSPLLLYSRCVSGGRPRGPQFTGMPFQLQLAICPAGGTVLKSNFRELETNRSRWASRSESTKVQPDPHRTPGASKPASLVTSVNVPFPLLRRSEEHTSELQSLRHLVCRLL